MGYPTTLPDLERVSNKRRRSNEREIEVSMDEIEARLLSMPDSGKTREEWRRDLRESLREMVQSRFGGEASYADVLLSDDSFNVTSSFLGEARAFNPALGLEDLYQALRNVWIMNSLQLFREEPIVYTPSIFAYSMLYPYTDNRLDDPSIDPAEKARSGRRLRDRLAGATLLPSSPHEADVFRLIGMIEGVGQQQRDLRSVNRQQALGDLSRVTDVGRRRRRRHLGSWRTACSALPRYLCVRSAGPDRGRPAPTEERPGHCRVDPRGRGVDDDRSTDPSGGVTATTPEERASLGRRSRRHLASGRIGLASLPSLCEAEPTQVYGGRVP